MNLTSKLFITILLLIFAAAGFGCSSNLTAEAPGQVTSTVLDRDTKTSKKKTSSNKKKRKTTTSVETEIDYIYTVDGKNYSGYTEKDGDVQNAFRPGTAVVVCYNPANPEESDVFTSGTKCGS
jgi:hypothetical protein